MGTDSIHPRASGVDLKGGVELSDISGRLSVGAGLFTSLFWLVIKTHEIEGLLGVTIHFEGTDGATFPTANTAERRDAGDFLS